MLAARLSCSIGLAAQKQFSAKAWAFPVDKIEPNALKEIQTASKKYSPLFESAPNDWKLLFRARDSGSVWRRSPFTEFRYTILRIVYNLS